MAFVLVGFLGFVSLRFVFLWIERLRTKNIVTETTLGFVLDCIKWDKKKEIFGMRIRGLILIRQ